MSSPQRTESTSAVDVVSVIGAVDDAPVSDTRAVLADLHRQIEDLTATVEAHQRIFERLYADGRIPRQYAEPLR